MDTFRKWLNKPKADDKSLLARFYHADRSLTAVASELDSFDGRAEPDRCSRLVSRLRHCQDKVLAITNLIMEELLSEDRDPRAFRAKFPEEVLQENLAGQLWFGAECLAAGSSIVNREQESKEMRPLAQAVTKSLGNVRSLLRDQCLRNNVPNSKTLHLDINDSTTEQLYESLKIFDRLFAEFELRYVSAMVQVKTKQEYEMQELICVLYSETLQRALKLGLLEQEKVDAFDPALMFSIPRLAIIAGLVIYPKGPLNMELSSEELSEMFRPFRTILIKIRDLLRSLSKNELYQLEKLLCTNEDIYCNIQVGASSIEAPTMDQENNNNRVVATTEATIVQSLVEQRNNSMNTSTNSALIPAESTNNELPNTSRLATRSPSMSSVSADSIALSSSTPSPSPSPSPSLVSTTSGGDSTSTTQPEWSDNDEDHPTVDSEGNELPKELDIVTDCASGYLIPNTNFGNLLQPQEVPLTDNFIASEDEFGNINTDESADPNVPTTSVEVTNRLSQNQMTINTPTSNNNCGKTDTTPSSSSSCRAKNKHLASTNCSASSSNSSRRRSSHAEHSCSENTACNSSRSHRQHHHHNHAHHHSHHHHHHYQRTRNSCPKGRHCNNEVCQSDGSKKDISKTSTSPKQQKTASGDSNQDTSSVDSTSTSSLSDGDTLEPTLPLRPATRSRFKSTESLLHRLFVCIAGVSDQLQTNFAADLRHILRSVFLMNMSPSEDEITIPDKPKESEMFEFRASENDVIQESAGSNQSIYSAEEVNPELDNVFNSGSSTTSTTNGYRHSTGGSTVQRGNTIDMGTSDVSSTAPGRTHIGRSRSLGDQEHLHNDNLATASHSSNNRRRTSYINERRANNANNNNESTQRHSHRNRNNSVGSNSCSSTSSGSNSPVSVRNPLGYVRSNNMDATSPTQTASVCMSPPAWIPDEKAPRCMACRTAFTAFRRRHHCRNCGGVFCGHCSNASAPLPKYGLTKAVRVCRDCYVREVRVNAAAATVMSTAGAAS